MLRTSLLIFSGAVIITIATVGFGLWSYRDILPAVVQLKRVGVGSDRVEIVKPSPSEIVTHKFTVEGKALGTWFFEASFPVKIVSADGKVVFATPAQAQSDWMTTNLVAFKAELTVPENITGKYTLRLEKDNPSGLTQNEASVEMPIIIN